MPQDSSNSFTQVTGRDDDGSMENRRKYRRISLTKRNLLLEKIFFENKKIKNAARELGINYSSAKTILHLYRKKTKKQIHQSTGEEKRCRVQVVESSKRALNKLDIVVSQGGRNMCSISINGGNTNVAQQSLGQNRAVAQTPVVAQTQITDNTVPMYAQSHHHHEMPSLSFTSPFQHFPLYPTMDMQNNFLMNQYNGFQNMIHNYRPFYMGQI